MKKHQTALHQLFFFLFSFLLCPLFSLPFSFSVTVFSSIAIGLTLLHAFSSPDVPKRHIWALINNAAPGCILRISKLRVQKAFNSQRLNLESSEINATSWFPNPRDEAHWKQQEEAWDHSRLFSLHAYISFCIVIAEALSNKSTVEWGSDWNLVMSEQQKMGDVFCNGVRLKSMKLEPSSTTTKQIISRPFNMQRVRKQCLFNRQAVN